MTNIPDLHNGTQMLNLIVVMKLLQKIMPHQSGNQEIYEVFTDHTSSNEIQMQQHENEEINQLTNEIHLQVPSKPSIEN